MAPGRRLMMNLRVPAKLFLVAGSLTVPLCLILAITVANLVGEWRYAATEREAVQVMTQVFPAVVQTQVSGNHAVDSACRGMVSRIPPGGCQASVIEPFFSLPSFDLNISSRSR